MPIKILQAGTDARSAILSGVKKLHDPVAATLGPKGRNILIEDARGRPLVTKDGVTVANEITLENPFENMGALLVKEAASKTNDTAGDGTTTATILAYAMMEEGLQHLGKGANPILIKRGMDQAVSEISAELKNIATEVKTKEEYEAIATISSQDPEIGKTIANVIDEVGEDGIVTIEDGQSLHIEQRIVEGMQFEAGYKSAAFVTNHSNQTVELSNCHVLVTDAKIIDPQQILGLLNVVAQKNIKDIAIIADEIEGDALALLCINKIKGVLRVVAIKAPGYKESKQDILRDIAAVTGAKFASPEEDLPVEKARLEHLGFCKSIVVTKSETTIIQGSGTPEEVAARVDLVKSTIKDLKSDYEIEQVNKRIARMTGGVAVISVGGATEVEQQERKHRVEDALSAVRAASSEGILPGGGTALLRARAVLLASEKDVTDPDILAGRHIVYDAVAKPLAILAANAGQDPEEVHARVVESGVGYNALTGVYENLIFARVIDPTLVTRSALENAASVASMFLTLEGTIVNKPLDTQEKALQAMMGHR